MTDTKENDKAIMAGDGTKDEKEGSISLLDKPKMKLYIAIAGGVLVVLLLLIFAIIVIVGGSDVSVPHLISVSGYGFG